MRSLYSSRLYSSYSLHKAYLLLLYTVYLVRSGATVGAHRGSELTVWWGCGRGGLCGSPGWGLARGSSREEKCWRLWRNTALGRWLEEHTLSRTRQLADWVWCERSPLPYWRWGGGRWVRDRRGAVLDLTAIARGGGGSSGAASSVAWSSHPRWKYRHYFGFGFKYFS